MDLLELPFKAIRLPNFKLRLPTITQPPAMLVFAIVLGSYFLVFSGIIYDIIVEPPSIGSELDPVTKQYKPVAFLQWRVNGQYIIEGLSAGSMFVIGAVGFILLDRSNGKSTSNRNRYLLLLAGALCVILSYAVSMVFLRMKIPGYLQS